MLSSKLCLKTARPHRKMSERSFLLLALIVIALVIAFSAAFPR